MSHRPAFLVAFVALAGCLAPPPGTPVTSEVRFLVLVPPAAALDSVAAWAGGSDVLQVAAADGALSIRDRRPGQHNEALVEARPQVGAMTEVIVASRYTMAPSFRDLGVMVYAGLSGERGAAFALPRPGSPSCRSVEEWRERLEAPAVPDADPAPDDAEPVEEVSPELIGGLAGLQRRAAYPEAMRRAGSEGVVLVQFVVEETGAVGCAQAVASPHPQFTASALEAVGASQFTPGTQRGVPVKVRFTVPITFTLR